MGLGTGGARERKPKTPEECSDYWGQEAGALYSLRQDWTTCPPPLSPLSVIFVVLEVIWVKKGDRLSLAVVQWLRGGLQPRFTVKDPASPSLALRWVGTRSRECPHLPL